MTKYSHLSQEQRYQIEALIKAGESLTSVGRIVGVHKSTISREIKRNSFRGCGSSYYRAGLAQRKTRYRHERKPKRIRFTNKMRKQIVRWLVQKRLSPELISVIGRRKDPSFVSHETIYRWIWHCKFTYEGGRPFQNLYRLLKHGYRRGKRGNYRARRGMISDRTFIDKRPMVVLKRKRIGDIESDLMLGRRHLPGLLVLVDRASLKTFLTPIKSKASDHIISRLVARMKSHTWLKTITYDNDMAFKGHQKINQLLKVRSYFTHPFSSQEKGTVENRIGLLRMFLPKKTDFSRIAPSTIRKIENLINDRPIRKFGYKSANEVFQQKYRSYEY